MTRAAASAWVKRSRLLGELPALRAATLTGQVTADHVRRVQDVVGRVGLPAVVAFDEVLARKAIAPVTQVIARRPRHAAMKNLPHKWTTTVKKNSSTPHT